MSTSFRSGDAVDTGLIRTADGTGHPRSGIAAFERVPSSTWDGSRSLRVQGGKEYALCYPIQPAVGRFSEDIVPSTPVDLFAFDSISWPSVLASASVAGKRDASAASGCIKHHYGLASPSNCSMAFSSSSPWIPLCRITPLASIT